MYNSKTNRVIIKVEWIRKLRLKLIQEKICFIAFTIISKQDNSHQLYTVHLYKISIITQQSYTMRCSIQFNTWKLGLLHLKFTHSHVYIYSLQEFYNEGVHFYQSKCKPILASAIIRYSLVCISNTNITKGKSSVRYFIMGEHSYINCLYLTTTQHQQFHYKSLINVKYFTLQSKD